MIWGDESHLVFERFLGTSKPLNDFVKTLLESQRSHFAAIFAAVGLDEPFLKRWTKMKFHLSIFERINDDNAYHLMWQKYWEN